MLEQYEVTPGLWYCHRSYRDQYGQSYASQRIPLNGLGIGGPPILKKGTAQPDFLTVILRNTRRLESADRGAHGALIGLVACNTA